MAIELPPKKYYSFTELAERFQCEVQDLLHLVIERQITPSFYLAGGRYQELQINKDEDEDGIHLFPSAVLNSDASDDMDEECYQGLHGFHYLVWMLRTGGSECVFNYVSKSAEYPDEGDIVYRIPRQLDLQDVLKDGVFMADELVRFESRHGKTVDTSQVNKPMSTRERTSYLNIVGAMLVQLTAGKANDTTVITQAVNDYGNKPGISQRKLQEAFAAAKRSLGAS